MNKHVIRDRCVRYSIRVMRRRLGAAEGSRFNPCYLTWEKTTAMRLANSLSLKDLDTSLKYRSRVNIYKKNNIK